MLSLFRTCYLVENASLRMCLLTQVSLEFHHISDLYWPDYPSLLIIENDWVHLGRERPLACVLVGDPSQHLFSWHGAEYTKELTVVV